MIPYKYLVPIVNCVERQLHDNTTWSWLNLDDFNLPNLQLKLFGIIFAYYAYHIITQGDRLNTKNQPGLETSAIVCKTIS